MARYVVMEPPADAKATDARILRDGFAVLGFLLPPLWLLWHRLWLAALVAFGLMLGLSAFGEATGMPIVGSLLSLLVSLFVGLEGREMAIAGLRRRGWSEVAAFEAEGLADAEIRYAYADGRADEPTAARHPMPEARMSPRPAGGPALGLLSYPGQR